MLLFLLKVVSLNELKLIVFPVILPSLRPTFIFYTLSQPATLMASQEPGWQVLTGWKAPRVDSVIETCDCCRDIFKVCNICIYTAFEGPHRTGVTAALAFYVRPFSEEGGKPPQGGGDI